MKTKINQGFTLIELLVVITIIAILASLAVPTFNVINDKAQQMKGTSNARQIIMSMKAYASDNAGAYPDSDPAMQPRLRGAVALPTGIGGGNLSAFDPPVKDPSRNRERQGATIPP